jgi:hypothetical protein
MFRKWRGVGLLSSRETKAKRPLLFHVNFPPPRPERSQVKAADRPSISLLSDICGMHNSTRTHTLGGIAPLVAVEVCRCLSPSPSLCSAHANRHCCLTEGSHERASLQEGWRMNKVCYSIDGTRQTVHAIPFPISHFQALLFIPAYRMLSALASVGDV